jgi:cobalt-zinc-cadmium resistance protein CzcA
VIGLVATSLPAGMKVVYLYDRTELVDHVIDTVRGNLFEGGLLAVAVLLCSSATSAPG